MIELITIALVVALVFLPVYFIFFRNYPAVNSSQTQYFAKRHDMAKSGAPVQEPIGQWVEREQATFEKEMELRQSAPTRTIEKLK